MNFLNSAHEHEMDRSRRFGESVSVCVYAVGLWREK